MNKLPPTSGLASAIRRLPRAQPGLPVQVADIDGFPYAGCFRVTFIARRNSRPECRAWFWGIDSAEQVDRLPARVHGGRRMWADAAADPTSAVLPRE